MTEYSDIVKPSSRSISTDITTFTTLSLVPSGFIGYADVADTGILYRCNGTFKTPLQSASISSTGVRPVTILIGNSISLYMQQIDQYRRYFQAEQFIADALLGKVLEWPEVIGGTGNSCIDNHGVFGHGGAILSGIISDINTIVFPALDNSGVIPDLVWLIALYENDIGWQSGSLSTITATSDTLIALIRAKWPGVKILLSGSHPDTRTTVPAQVSLYNGINNYVLSKDNGIDIFSYLPNGYEDPNNPGCPLKTVVTGGISGGVLTVTDIPAGHLIQIGDLLDYHHMITTIDTGTVAGGGIGTYTVANILSGTDNPVASGSSISVYHYTDEVVHPSGPGAILNARAAMVALKRMVNSPSSKYITKSKNLLLTGSVTYNGTNHSGTMPSSDGSTSDFTFISALPIPVVHQALNPGLLLSWASIPDTTAVTTTILLNTLRMIHTLPEAIEFYKGFIKIKIISGAEQISHLSQADARVDNGVLSVQNTAWNEKGSGGTAGAIEWKNGEEITFSSGIIRSVGGALITEVHTYLNMYTKPHATGGISIQIMSVGLETVQPNKGTVVLVGGTATVSSIDNKLLPNSKITLSTKTPAGTPGAVFVSDKTAGTSFTITSTSATDTSVIAWEISNK